MADIIVLGGMTASPPDDTAAPTRSGEQSADFEREMAGDWGTTTLGKRDRSSHGEPETPQLKRQRSSLSEDAQALSVSMKLAGRGNGLPGGVSGINMRLADKVSERFGHFGNPKAMNYQVAEKRAVSGMAFRPARNRGTFDH